MFSCTSIVSIRGRKEAHHRKDNILVIQELLFNSTNYCYFHKHTIHNSCKEPVMMSGPVLESVVLNRRYTLPAKRGGRLVVDFLTVYFQIEIVIWVPHRRKHFILITGSRSLYCSILLGVSKLDRRTSGVILVHQNKQISSSEMFSETHCLPAILFYFKTNLCLKTSVVMSNTFAVFSVEMFYIKG